MRFKWPSITPDLNPEEKIWGVSVKNLKNSARKSQSKPNSSDAVKTSWNNFDIFCILITLFESMNGKQIKVIKNKEYHIDY